MSKKNYNKMYDETKEDVNAEVESVVEEVVTEIEPVIEETAPVEETPKKKPEKKHKFGVVTNCAKLNMRIAPKADAKVRGILDQGTTVIILGEEGDFYKIGNPDDPDYCMKKYISVK